MDQFFELMQKLPYPIYLVIVLLFFIGLVILKKDDLLTLFKNRYFIILSISLISLLAAFYIYKSIKNDNKYVYKTSNEYKNNKIKIDKFKLYENFFEDNDKKFGINITSQFDNQIEFVISSIGKGLFHIIALYAELEYYCYPPKKEPGLPPSPTGIIEPNLYDIVLREDQKRYFLYPLTPDNEYSTWKFEKDEIELFGIDFSYSKDIAFSVKIKAEIYDHIKSEQIIVESDEILFYRPPSGAYNSYSRTLDKWVPLATKHCPGDYQPDFPPIIYKVLIIDNKEVRAFIKQVDKDLFLSYKDVILSFLANNDEKLKFIEVASYIKLVDALPIISEIIKNEKSEWNSGWSEWYLKRISDAMKGYQFEEANDLIKETDGIIDCIEENTIWVQDDKGVFNRKYLKSIDECFNINRSEN